MLSELINNSPLESGAFQPVLNSLPASWKLAVKFDPRMWNRNASVPRPSVDWGKVAAPFIDKSGNLWTFNTEDHSITEFIGYAALEPEFGQAPADSIQPAGKP
jgi:hypothetical protein